MILESILEGVRSTGLFLVVLSILIVVHEWGHFITARKVGVKVETFSIGFGKKLFSRVVNGTEFCISLIPLGGYVKMAGDERAECKGAPDEFYSKSPGHRALIALNGPVVNFLLAYVCLVVVFMIGYPDFSTRVGQLVEKYPAAQAGLQTGDEILEVNDVPVANWTELKAQIMRNDVSQIKLFLRRGEQDMRLTIIPQIEQQKNIFGQMTTARLIGIVPSEEIVNLRYGPAEALVKGAMKIVEITVMTYKSIYFMITGSMSPKNMAGPVMIFAIIRDAAASGLNHLIFIVGVISASLAIFNLLPIMPLDGGHLILLGIERLIGKPLPEKIDNIVAQSGFVVIMCFAVFVFYSDFEKIGLIDKVMSIFR